MQDKCCFYRKYSGSKHNTQTGSSISGAYLILVTRAFVYSYLNYGTWATTSENRAPKKKPLREQSWAITVATVKP